jgi:aryl-alcohol dehydrogenase-like predicted oxidoreductase
MLDREPENGLLDVLGANGVGCVCCSPLAQGVLTNRYLTHPGRLPALRSINYTGPISIEWEDAGMDRLYGARQALEFVRSLCRASDLVADAGAGVRLGL